MAGRFRTSLHHAEHDGYTSLAAFLAGNEEAASQMNEGDEQANYSAFGLTEGKL